MPCTINHISNNCASGGQLSCSPSVIHGITQHIAGDEYGIKHIIYHCKGMLSANHGRCYHGKHLILTDCLAHGKQLYGLARLMGILKVSSAQSCDTLGKYLIRIHIFPHHQGRKDGNFPTCIMAFHVSRRITLSIPLLLRLLQYRGKIGSLFIHLAQDIIGGSV